MASNPYGYDDRHRECPGCGNGRMKKKPACANCKEKEDQSGVMFSDYKLCLVSACYESYSPGDDCPVHGECEANDDVNVCEDKCGDCRICDEKKGY